MDSVLRISIINLTASIVYLYINKEKLKKDSKSTIKSLLKNCLLPINVIILLGMWDTGGNGGVLPDEDYYMGRRGR